MANKFRAEADIHIGGVSRTVALSMTTVALLAQRLSGVTTLTELHQRLAKGDLLEMPVVLACLLEGNGIDVSQEDIQQFDVLSYMQMVPQLLTVPERKKPEHVEGDETSARPRKPARPTQP